jgi:hypothetical protein
MTALEIPSEAETIRGFMAHLLQSASRFDVVERRATRVVSLAL